MIQARSNDTYAWPGHANVSRAYTPNGLNQYSAVGGTSFTYDTNGNLTSDGTNSFVYDTEIAWSPARSAAPARRCVMIHRLALPTLPCHHIIPDHSELDSGPEAQSRATGIERREPNARP
jgi:hypothetical protein